MKQAREARSWSKHTQRISLCKEILQSQHDKSLVTFQEGQFANLKEEFASRLRGLEDIMQIESVEAAKQNADDKAVIAESHKIVESGDQTVQGSQRTIEERDKIIESLRASSYMTTTNQRGRSPPSSQAQVRTGSMPANPGAPTTRESGVSYAASTGISAPKARRWGSTSRTIRFI